MVWAKSKSLLTAIALSVSGTAPVVACDLALAFAVDISGSVDSEEFGIQMRGLANGLRDGVIAEALVKAEAQLMLLQWTGSSRQVVSVPWTKITSFEDLETIATQIEQAERGWRNFSTAIGEALKFTLEQFDPVPTCKRLIVDVSGDGRSNEGVAPMLLLPAFRQKGITINALVIEGEEDDLTAYFWENVITGEGAFVVTANGFGDYPARMKRKLLREVTKAVSALEPMAPPGRGSPENIVR